MCEFKVGDLVKHDSSGNEYTVKAVSPKSLWFEGFNLAYDIGMYHLVERKPAPYQFKVGDKGKCRDYVPYEVIAVDVAGLAKGRTVAAVRGGYLYGFLSDGSENSTSRGSGDLMPPTKTVWRVELTGVNNPRNSGLLDMSSTRYYNSRELAEAGIARGKKIYTSVKGPFPEEREA